MPIPTLEAFKRSTKNPALLQRRRGPNIQKVDRALKNWWDQANGATPERKLGLLAAIVSACSKWMKLKRRRWKKDLTIRRRQHIAALANAALDELAEIGEMGSRVAFDRRKVRKLSRRSREQGVGLKGSYRNERKLYLRSNKTAAPSATLFNMIIREYAGEVGGYDAFLKFKDKDFQQLTEKDFRVLTGFAEEAPIPSGKVSWEVEYMAKRDRMQHWVVPTEKGLLKYKVGGGLLSTSHETIWAMDEYGNLFCVDTAALVQRNHSSINAGKDVICAGAITIKNGQLLKIDNGSGHYKPNRTALHTALAILDEDGVDLSQAEVHVHEVEDLGQGDLVTKKYKDARRFLENPKSAPDPE